MDTAIVEPTVVGAKVVVTVVETVALVTVVEAKVVVAVDELLLLTLAVDVDDILVPVVTAVPDDVDALEANKIERA